MNPMNGRASGATLSPVGFLPLGQTLTIGNSCFSTDTLLAQPIGFFGVFFVLKTARKWLYIRSIGKIDCNFPPCGTGKTLISFLAVGGHTRTCNLPIV